MNTQKYKTVLNLLTGIIILSLILMPSGVSLAQSMQPPEPATPFEGETPSGEGLKANMPMFSLMSIPLIGDTYQAGADRLVALQRFDGGWGWPLDYPLPDPSASNIVGPIAQGLAEAYLHTGDLNHRAALVDAGAFLLSKTNNFSPSDGYLAATLDDILGGTAYTDYVKANFYNLLAAGTYNRNGAGTLFDTAGYVNLIRTNRSGNQANMAAWDLGLGLVGAASAGADTTTWITAVEAEINELDGANYYDVIGLAGAIYGLAYVGLDFDPTAGQHAAANSLADLGVILDSYQISSGGFAWNSAWVVVGEEAVQETVYSILALDKLNRATYLSNIQTAADFLGSVQLPTGGWENYPAYSDGENNEVTAEALWGINVTYPLTEVWVCETGDCGHPDANFNTIQEAVTAVQSNGTIHVAAGTYTEQVTVTKSLHLIGAGVGSSFIAAPASLPASSNATSSIILIGGSGVDVELTGFTVTGPGPSGCGSIRTGIYVYDGANANIHHNTIQDIRDSAFSGCQNGVAIAVGRQYWSTTGTATIDHNIIIGYQKGGVVVDNSGSDATITNNTITGVGTTAVIAQNGIQISRGATATLAGNAVTGNSFHLLGNASDWGSAGILLYQNGSVNLTGGNTVSGNDQSLYVDGAAVTVGADSFGPSTAPLYSGYEVTNYTGFALDLTSATFPGELDNCQIEERIWHGIDDAASGLVTWVAGNLYVASPESKIQNAVDKATAGDTVNVCAGTYAENVSIPKSVSLKGAQYDIDVSGRTAASVSESTIQGLVTVNSSDVNINGFTLTNPGQTYALLITPSSSNIAVTYNMVDTVGAVGLAQNVHAIMFQNGADSVTIANNSFNNIKASTKSVSAIGVLDSASTNTSTGLLIQGNSFTNIASGTKGAYGVILNNGAGVPGAQIKDNFFSGLSGGWTHAIGLEGPTPNAIVTGNIFSNLTAAGADNAAILFEKNPVGGTVTVSQNQFNGTAFYGVAVHPNDLPFNYSVIAESNWWDSASGPGIVGPGTGTLVGPNVDFTPWLCDGTDTDPAIGFQPNLTTSPCAEQTITFAALSNKSVGDPDFTVSATASSGLTVTFTVGVSDQCTISGNTVHLTGAGNCTVTAHQAGDASFKAAPNVDQTFTIGKLDPIITWANPADIVYGTTLTGTQLNANASVPGNFAYTPAAGTVLNADAGQFLHVDFTPIDNANYNTASLNVTINVLKAPLTITADNKSNLYGSITPTLTASYSGFVNGDTPANLDTPVTLTTTATIASPAGTYPITASGATDTNYDITLVNGTLTITKAPLTITADNKSKFSGSANPTLTASYSGFVNGDTPASLDTPVTLTTTATTPSPAGTYPITASGATDVNYTITFVNGTLTVIQANPKIAVDKKAPNIGVGGGSVTYTYSVTNPGNVPLSTVTVSDDKCSVGSSHTGDSNGNTLLDPGETWTYTCTCTPSFTSYKLTNKVTVKGTYATTTYTATDSETLYPFTLKKKMYLYWDESSSGHGNYSVPYLPADNTLFTVEVYKDNVLLGTYTVSQNSPQKLWLGYGSYTFKEVNLPAGYLAADSSFTYTTSNGTCFHISNRDHQRHDDDKNPTERTFANVITYNLAIDKTGPATAHKGATITYNYTVTNSGPASVKPKVTDDKCSYVTYVSGDTNHDGRINPGETWNFKCTYKVTSSIGSKITNKATVFDVDQPRSWDIGGDTDATNNKDTWTLTVIK